MVEGIDIFRQRLGQHQDSLVLIGGAACDQWFTEEGIEFRATRDLDIVLLAEVLSPECIRDFKRFVADGQYQVQERTTGRPVLYRFAKPATPGFPWMLELFSRQPDDLELADGQQIVPIPAGVEARSLSAILLDESYYRMLLEHHERRNGLGIATVAALIPLKARAWLDLSQRSSAGEIIDSRHLKKHRTDVFGLIATLPASESVVMDPIIRDDLRTFAAAFPPSSDQWPAILESLRKPFGRLQPASLLEALTRYYQL